MQSVFIFIISSFHTHVKECGGEPGRGHAFTRRRLTADFAASLWCSRPCDSSKHHNIKLILRYGAFRYRGSFERP